MDHYIFLTANIHPVGGMQAYVAAKAKFLEAEGWAVHIFFSGRNNIGGCAFRSLEQYTEGWYPEISIPPGNWPSSLRNSVLRGMRRQIGHLDGKIVVESQASAYALWGEALAEQIEGKHFCFICNERFRGKDRFYEEYLDFFWFKQRRRELAGISSSSISQLFNGYQYIPAKDNLIFIAATEGTVQDIESTAVNELQMADWNICYIGRIDKGYVPNILNGVRSFAEAHPKKKIQFIFVGDTKKRVELIKNTFSDIENVKLIFLGNCIPIPKSLFQKVNVVIAGSGSALCAAQENVLTIVADANNYMSNGILGIDTFNVIYAESQNIQTSFDVSLEKVLVKGSYAHQPICVQKLPVLGFCERYFRDHFRMLDSSVKSVEYYDVIKNRKWSHRLSWTYYRSTWMFKIIIRKYFPFLFSSMYQHRK